MILNYKINPKKHVLSGETNTDNQIDTSQSENDQIAGTDVDAFFCILRSVTYQTDSLFSILKTLNPTKVIQPFLDTDVKDSPIIYSELLANGTCANKSMCNWPTKK